MSSPSRPDGSGPSDGDSAAAPQSRTRSAYPGGAADDAQPAGSRTRSAFAGAEGGGAAEAEPGPFDDAEVEALAAAAAADDGAAEVLVEDGPEGGFPAGVETDFGGGEAARGAFTPDELEALRPHVVNLQQGRFSGGGVLRTTPEDVDAIFREHLPRALEEARRRGQPLRIVFWAHGGLVSEQAGVRAARDLVPWWKANQVYPVYFIWETGFWNTLVQLIGGRRELAATRDLFDVSDRAVEEVARRAGGPMIWGGMKHSAERSVGPDGGAAFVARRLGEFCAGKTDVEVHAAGHSAGSIFHSFFVPAALAAGAPAFRTVGFLAPAIRSDAFLARFGALLQPGGGVDALTVLTMKKDFEQADNCGQVYRKSLLYLVSRGLEARRGDAILGLEESLRASPEARRIFGLAGEPATAHGVVWSKTAAAAGRSASRATSHGGFDNDAPSMESVLRRVVGAGDADAIVPFPADASRDFAFPGGRASIFRPPQRPQPARPPAPADPAGAAAGRRIALCVGIDEYPQSPLSGCVADANTWSRELERLGFTVTRLLNRQATQEAIRAALRDLVSAGRPGDVLVFQYAGHGTHFDDDGADEQDRQDEALVPVDFDRGRFLLDDEQFRIMDALKPGASLTCFYDCCHSGTMARVALASVLRAARGLEGDVRPRFLDPTPAMVAEYRRRRAATRGLARRTLRTANDLKAVVFSACRDDEVALEQAGHGVFTTKVTPLLRDAVAARLPHADFQAKITRAFGPGPSQHPGLDGADANLRRPLLAGVSAAAAGGRDGEGGAADGRIRLDLPEEAWIEFLSSLSREARAELRRRLDEVGAGD